MILYYNNCIYEIGYIYDTRSDWMTRKRREILYYNNCIYEIGYIYDTRPNLVIRELKQLGRERQRRRLLNF